MSEGVWIVLESTDQCVPFYEARKERQGNSKSKKVKNEGQKDDRLYFSHWRKDGELVMIDHVCLYTLHRDTLTMIVDTKLGNRLSVTTWILGKELAATVAFTNTVH